MDFNKYEKNQRWYNYWTSNLNVNEGIPYTIVVEIKEAKNISGKLFVASPHEVGGSVSTICQFPVTVIESDRLINNSVIIKNITSSSNVQENYGLRTFYDNVSLNDNEELIFRISVLENQYISADNFKYEPYFVKENTIVVQNSNHTLKAIWKKVNS